MGIAASGMVRMSHDSKRSGGSSRGEARFSHRARYGAGDGTKKAPRKIVGLWRDQKTFPVRELCLGVIATFGRRLITGARSYRLRILLDGFPVELEVTDFSVIVFDRLDDDLVHALEAAL